MEKVGEIRLQNVKYGKNREITIVKCWRNESEI